MGMTFRNDLILDILILEDELEEAARCLCSFFRPACHPR